MCVVWSPRLDYKLNEGKDIASILSPRPHIAPITQKMLQKMNK